MQPKMAFSVQALRLLTLQPSQYVLLLVHTIPPSFGPCVPLAFLLGT